MIFIKNRNAVYIHKKIKKYYLLFSNIKNYNIYKYLYFNRLSQIWNQYTKKFIGNK
jgi:hypothetical protein